MTTQWGRSCRLEEVYNYRDEIGWLVTLWTRDTDEIEQWCCKHLRDYWEIQKLKMQSTKPGWHSWLVHLKVDSDRDYMLLKLSWCV